MGKLIEDSIAWAKEFHGTYRLIVDLCTLNDGEEFQEPYKEIHLK